MKQQQQKKSTFGWNITYLVSTQKEFLTCLIRNLFQNVSMGKWTDFSNLKKKSTGVILNICNGEMLEAEIEWKTASICLSYSLLEKELCTRSKKIFLH